jgi:peptidoglycan/xylan/chitin deacetylase (PgdA/CDA1 family)
MVSTVPILTFHAIDDRPSVISCTPEVFREGMALLHEAGYRTMGLLEAVDCLHRGGGFPKRAFVLTFDDGFQSVYREAFPVMRELGMRATVFLTVGAARGASTDRLPSFEGRTMLSWREVREMQTAGVEAGAHTLTHPDLTRLPADRIAVEMRESREVIEDAVGAAVRTFAYPFGRYHPDSQRIAREYFSCACADTLGLASRRSDPYALERVDTYYLRHRRVFALTTTPLFPWYVAARNLPRRLRRAFERRRSD